MQISCSTKHLCSALRDCETNINKCQLKWALCSWVMISTFLITRQKTIPHLWAVTSPGSESCGTQTRLSNIPAFLREICFMDLNCHSAEYPDLPLKCGGTHHLTGAHLHAVFKVFYTGQLSPNLQRFIHIQQVIFLAYVVIPLTVKHMLLYFVEHGWTWAFSLMLHRTCSSSWNLIALLSWSLKRVIRAYYSNYTSMI